MRSPQLPITHGAASPAASTAWLWFIKLSASRCHSGVGMDLAFLRCLLVWWRWPSPAMPSVLGRSWDTSWFRPHGCERAGGKTRAAGVQSSLSSCNIPHVKYEAKFLLIPHEEPGVNRVLPISSSTELRSLCLHPQTASETFRNPPLLLPALTSRTAARRAVSTGCLALENRARALLGSVGLCA